jgi:hypothetical protein
VVRIAGYRSKGPGSIPSATRERWWEKFGWCVLDRCGSGYGHLERSWEFSDEPSGSIKCWETIKWLHNWWTLE